MYSLGLPAYLAFKEIWRNKGRFLLISLVIALITLLVLFIAALGEGLANANREYLSRLDAGLLVFHDKTDYIIGASHLDRSQLSSIRQVAGVAEAGQIGFANADVLLPGASAPLKVSLIGVEPGRPGLPPVLQGRTFYSRLASEVILDRSAALRSGLKTGDSLTIRVSQGTRDQTYTLRVVGITDGEQYQFQPSIFVPFFTWDQVRPKSEAEINSTSLVSNLIAVRLKDPGQIEAVRQGILSNVSNVEVATIPQAILAVPGYTAQQSTIQTQGFLYPVHRPAGDWRFFSDPGPAKSGSNRGAQSHWRFQPRGRSRCDHPDYPDHRHRGWTGRILHLPVIAVISTHRPDRF